MAKQKLIFSGRPSQIINLPACLKGLVIIALIGAIHLFAASTFPFQWRGALAQAIAVLIGVALPFAKTAFTEIVIDGERITWRQGILKSRVSTLELKQLMDVTPVYPWWQRWFGTGLLVLRTNDPRYPVRHLPGIRHAELLRAQLNQAASAVRGSKLEVDLRLGIA